MQGKWLIVSIDKGEGPIVPDGDFATYTLTIDGVHISTATAKSSAYPRVPAKFDFKSDPIKMDIPFGGGRPSSKAVTATIIMSGSALQNDGDRRRSRRSTVEIIDTLRNVIRERLRTSGAGDRPT